MILRILGALVLGLSALTAPPALADTDAVIPFDEEGPLEEVPVSDHPIRNLPVLRFRSSDARMNEAYGLARASLPNVIAATEKRNGWFSPSLALRIAVKVPDTEKPIEFVWVDTIRREGDHFTAQLASWPRRIPGKRLRDPIIFVYPQIYDWAVQAVDGRFYGYFTTRVMLRDMQEPLRSRIGVTLVPRPVPRLWQ